MRKVPEMMMKSDQKTMAIHLSVFCLLPSVQWSYSHMPPMGWKQMSVPSRAPMSETRPPKTGMALAMMYAMPAQLPVQPIQVVQWIVVLRAR